MIILSISLIIYKNYYEKRLVEESYNEILIDLENIKKNNNNNENSFEEGISENEIIEKYSKKFKMNEENFRKYIFPKLKKLRRKSGKML
jgi:hypothetical protein